MTNMDPIVDLLAKTRSQFIATADAFPADRWRTAPAEDKWSAAQIVGHTMQVEESIVRGAKKTLLKPPAPVPFFKRFHLPLALAGGRARKLKSPIALDESRVPAQAEYVEKITATRRGTLEFIDETRGRDLRPYTFPHPVFGPLNLYEWLRLIAYHELRHAKQIREVAAIFHR